MKGNAESMAEIFRVFGDPTRLKMIRLLAFNREFCKEKQLCVADLAKMLGITQPAASQHIKILKGIGIIESKREGFRVYYHIDSDAMALLRGTIDGFLEMSFNMEEKGITADNKSKRKPLLLSRVIKEGNAEIREFSYPSGVYAYSIRTEIDEKGDFVTKVIGNY